MTVGSDLGAKSRWAGIPQQMRIAVVGGEQWDFIGFGPVSELSGR
jgi:hypothetical protein